MKNQCKNQWEIWMGFCMALGAFLVDFGGVFGTLGPWFWVFRVGETRFFKISFFSCLDWFFCDLGRFWGGLGGHFGSQRATKMASKFDQKNEWFLDRSWKRSGAPKGGLTILGGDGKSPRGGVRGGVNPPLREGLRIIIYNFAKLGL